MQNKHGDSIEVQPSRLIRRLVGGLGLGSLLLMAPAIAGYVSQEAQGIERVLVPAAYGLAIILFPLALRPFLRFETVFARSTVWSVVHLTAWVALAGVLLLLVQEKALGKAPLVRLGIASFGFWIGSVPFQLRWEQSGWRISASARRGLAMLAVMAAWFLGIGWVEVQPWAFRGTAELALSVLAFVIILRLGFSGRGIAERRAHVIGVVAAVIGLLVAMAAIEGIFRSLPGLIPNFALSELPQRGDYLQKDIFFYEEAPIQVGRRFQPNLDVWIRGTAQDILVWNGRARFHRLPGAEVRGPRVHFNTDADGFRNPSSLPQEIDIVVGGDSFTVGLEVQEPWTDLLATATGMSVYNLSIPGFGPQAESHAVNIYGLEKDPEIVILAYFEGNDLRDAALFERAQAAGMSIPDLFLSEVTWDRSMVSLALLRGGAAAILRPILGNGPAKAQEGIVPIYPLEVTINGNRLNLSFLDGYVSVLSAQRETILASTNFEYATAALLEAADASRNSGARFILLYIPTKAHVYAPFLPETILAELTSTVRRMHLEDGLLAVDPEAFIGEPAALLQHIDDQAIALRDFAESQGMEFVDLTPFFQEQAAQGVELYLSLSIHWNEAGHKLTAEVVADYLSRP